jgi:2-C-methyl-D-erythritol 2,4-cyclodiphosphate synthase
MRETRIGLGYDVHAFAPGRRLVLGGVEVPFERGLAGHSDADVLTHALMDALLGAMREGDIGQHFPDTDPSWKGASSLDLLSRVADLMRVRGWRLTDADCVLVLEEPRISPYRDDMRAKMSAR